MPLAKQTATEDVTKTTQGDLRARRGQNDGRDLDRETGMTEDVIGADHEIEGRETGLGIEIVDETVIEMLEGQEIEIGAGVEIKAVIEIEVGTGSIHDEVGDFSISLFRVVIGCVFFVRTFH